MKKTYNPFKMWETYVGGIILVLFSFLSPPAIKISLPMIMISFELGFLFGWGSHSLVEVLRK